MKRKRSPFKFAYQNLEPRTMLATIALADGVLFMRGGNGADVATVSVSGSNVNAAITGAESASFPVADVDSIIFAGLAGNDTFTNNTAINSVAFGHAGNDTLIGGDGNDRLIAGSGNDVMRGNGGNDELRGGIDGRKELSGGDGNDRLFGGTNRNEIRGGSGNDVVFGGPEIDIVFGDDGEDELYPGHGENVVRGGAGNDLVIAGLGNDEIFGEDGNDRIYSSLGDDIADGGNGDDTIVAADGDDTLIGGTGNDYLSGGGGEDKLEGGAGDDRMRGDGGDDQLDGGSGYNRAFFVAPESHYRVAGSNLFVRDMLGDDGTDTLVGMDWIHFRANTTSGKSYAAESQVKEVITIRPIIVSNSNGSNTAEFFGTSEQEREIKELINDIYYQARVQVNWTTPRTWNNTFANVGNGGRRPFDDANKIIADGTAARVTSRDPLTINMFFIETVPGNANLSENQTNGLSLDGENGVTFQVGDNLPTFEDGRQAVANVAAHEIAHNLGLEHVSVTTNLLNFPNITGNFLNSTQRAQIIASRYSR